VARGWTEGRAAGQLQGVEQELGLSAAASSHNKNGSIEGNC